MASLLARGFLFTALLADNTRGVAVKVEQQQQGRNNKGCCDHVTKKHHHNAPLPEAGAHARGGGGPDYPIADSYSVNGGHAAATGTGSPTMKVIPDVKSGDSSNKSGDSSKEDTTPTDSTNDNDDKDA